MMDRFEQEYLREEREWKLMEEKLQPETVDCRKCKVKSGVVSLSRKIGEKMNQFLVSIGWKKIDGTWDELEAWRDTAIVSLGLLFVASMVCIFGN